MSTTRMAAVWALSIHKASDLLLLLALADAASDDGHSYPGIDELVRKTRVSRATVLRALDRLEATGEVFIRHSRRHGNQYLVLLGMDDQAIAAAMKMRFKWSDTTISVNLILINDRRSKSQFDTSEVSPVILEKSQNDTNEIALPNALSINLTLQKAQFDTSEVSRVTLDPLKLDDDESISTRSPDHHHQSPPPSPPTPDELTTLAPELRGLGLSSNVRSKLLEQGAERALALVLHAKSAGRNPAGLLVRMLEAGDDPANRYVEQARAMLRAPDLDRQADTEGRVEARANGQRPAVAPPPQPHPSLDERPGPHGMTVREVWHAALSQLALQLNQATFENYLKGAIVDRYADGVLWVRPPNPMTGIRMGQLIHVIEGVVSQIAGAPVTVRVASEEAA